jgi:predicted phage terminase large subunit-like protein
MSMPPWAWRPDLLANQVTGRRYTLPPHICWTSRSLVAKLQRGGARVAIHMPPRHGKSLLCATWLPVWYLLHNPRGRVVVASYDQGLSANHSRLARDYFSEVAPQLTDLAVSEDAHAAAYWETSQRGSCKAVGVKTGFTGHGADLLIIDDPLKDSEEAQSEPMREKLWQWWLGVAEKRLEPGANVVVIMHRWNRDDLVGRLLDREPNWDSWVLSALAREQDPMGRPEGDPLWPQRFPTEHWTRIRERGGWDWNALCQGDPKSEEGEIFKREWLEAATYSGEASGAQVIQSWDLKTKETTGGSYAVGIVAKFDGRFVRVVDVQRGRFGTVESIRRILAMRDRWGPGPILVEEKAAGASVIELLRGQIPGVIATNPEASKETRAMAVQPFVQDGSLRIPADAGWRAEYIDELADFPLGANDDQVDATSQLLGYALLRNQKVPEFQMDLSQKNPFTFG